MKEKETTLQDIHDQITMFMEIAATKEDLKQFATKEDLKNFATKDDLKKLATKDELQTLKADLKLEIGKARDQALAHADIKADEVVDRIGKVLYEDRKHDKNFKQTLISVMRKNDLASEPELKGLAQAI